MEQTNYANYVYDEFGLISGFRDIPIDIVPINLKECVVVHVSHQQDYSIIPKQHRRRPRWHNKKK